MRKIVAGLFMSLDGVVEAPEQWHFPYFNDQMGAAVASQMAAADTMLLGRKTYEEFAAYWPQQSDDAGFAAQMNGTPKLVASTTLKELAWENSTLLGEDAAAELTALKQQPGKDISITGSATLVRSLIESGVLDELRLLIHPVIVGSGKRLFDGGLSQTSMELTESETFTTGVVSLVYRPAREEAS